MQIKWSVKKSVYLGLAIVGIALPMSQFIPASLDGSFSVGAMLSEMTATATLRGVSFDFMVTALTGIVFGVIEAVRLKIRSAWVPLVGSVLIGFSFGLPCFLLLRELALERSSGE